MLHALSIYFIYISLSHDIRNSCNEYFLNTVCLITTLGTGLIQFSSRCQLLEKI